MKLFFKNELIEFYCDEEFFGIIPEPVPAYKMMPDWFKKINPKTNKRDHFGSFAFTAKKCMPLLDSMSLGFIIPLYGDVNVRVNKDGKLIEASKNPFGSINQTSIAEFHSIDQLGGKTSPTYPGPAIKFINKWIVKTAPGYSTLFIPPLNVFEPRFTCLSGLVDTDTYCKEVNFPAVWHLKDFDDVVSAGTPLVTAIPIKRSDSTRNPVIRKITKKEFEYKENLSKKQDSRRSVYTNEIRDQRK